MLKNNPNRTNHRLYKSLYKFMSNTILQVEEDNTVSEDDGDSASSKGSANKGKLLGTFKESQGK